MKEDRLAKAKEFGADQVWNPGKMDVVKAIMDLTDGYGCDIYIEATGHPASVVQGMQMIRKLGTFVEFSVFCGTYDPGLVHHRGQEGTGRARFPHLPVHLPVCDRTHDRRDAQNQRRGHQDVLSGSMGRGIPLRRRRGGGYQSRISVWRLSDTVNYVALHRGGEL